MDSKQQGLHIITLANSIIGVSILAMPYCFKQCGIILSIILLICSSIISRLACHFLLKSAIKARLRTFEFLAYHAFGSLGKFIIEIGMIGFLIGTCIAFFVVMGDLSPQIVAQMTQTENTDRLRTYILIVLALLCVLPLGLLRNVDSLSAVCTATIGFYACLVIKIMGESAPHILLGDWYDKVEFWRPDGILQCIPIFSMALFCQTQLFEIYQAIPNASLEKMNGLIRVAVNICTCVYIFVGVFGYIALSHEASFSGNILLVFKPSFMTEVMKIGFVLSVAFSFPLIIFPCRASLFSLLYKPTYTLHESTVMYIPEGKFKMLTFLIVLISLIIGIYIPNIELVLGLVGSTIGVMICVLFPAACFICMTSKNTNERILAQLMLLVGIIVMVLGTYANLYAIEEIAKIDRIITEKSIPQIEIMITLEVPEQRMPGVRDISNAERKHEEQYILDKLAEKIDEQRKEIRHEPPQPEAPDDNAEKVAELSPIKSLNTIKLVTKKSEVKKEMQDKINKVNLNRDTFQAKQTKEISPGEAKEIPIFPKKSEEVDKDAIQKEENELQEQIKKENKNEDKNLLKQQKLVEEQQKLIEEQKKILIEMKIESRKFEKNQQKLEKAKNDQNMKAVQNIENLAKLAIERIVETNTKLYDMWKSTTNYVSNPVVLPNNHKVTNSLVEQNRESSSHKLKLNLNSKKLEYLPIPIAFAQKGNSSDSLFRQNEVSSKANLLEPNIINLLKGYKKKIAEQGALKVDDTAEKLARSTEIKIAEEIGIVGNTSGQLKTDSALKSIEENSNLQNETENKFKNIVHFDTNIEESKIMEKIKKDKYKLASKVSTREIQNNLNVNNIKSDLLLKYESKNSQKDNTDKLKIDYVLSQTHLREKRDTEIQCEEDEPTYKTPSIKLVKKFSDTELERIKLGVVNLDLLNANSGMKILTGHLQSIAQINND